MFGWRISRWVRRCCPPSNYNIFYLALIRLSKILTGEEFGSQISLPDGIVNEVIEVDELDKGNISTTAGK